ncbi:MAG: cytochrome c biogenesis protein CcsA [Candidatus Heimdallarchaeota archaeon]
MLAITGFASLWGAITATWIAFILQWKTKNHGAIHRAWYFRLSVSAAFLLWAGLLALFIAFLTKDYSFVVVYENSDNDMNSFERIMATWAGRQGAMLLWAAFLATVVVSIIWHLAQDSIGSIESQMITILLFFSALIATFAGFSRPGPFDTRTASSDGLGLAPSLLNFWQLIHPPIAFLAYACFIVPYAAALAIFTKKDPKTAVPSRISWLMDTFMLLGWGLTSLFLLAGSIWAYEENWGGFWAWDPVETASLVLWLLGAIYFHVKALVPSSHPLRAFSAALGWIGVAFAAFIVRGGFLEGLHEYVGSTRAIIFGALLGGSLIALAAAAWRSRDELFPEFLFEWQGSSKKLELIAFWALVGASLANVVGLCIEVINALLSDNSSTPVVYYSLINGLLLLLLGGALVLCERKATKWQDVHHWLVFGTAGFLSLLIVFFGLPTQDLLGVAILALFGSLVLIQLVFVGSSVYSKQNLRRFGFRLTHFVIILAVLGYVAAGSQSLQTTSEIELGIRTEFNELGISVEVARVTKDYPNIDVWIVVRRGETTLGEVKLAQGVHTKGFWNKGAWIIEPFVDLYFQLDYTLLWFFYNEATPSPIPVVANRVPLANVFRLSFVLFSGVLILGSLSMWRKRP